MRYVDLCVELKSHLVRIYASFDVAPAAHDCVRVCCTHGRMFTWASLSQCHDAFSVSHHGCIAVLCACLMCEFALGDLAITCSLYDSGYLSTFILFLLFCLCNS